MSPGLTSKECHFIDFLGKGAIVLFIFSSFEEGKGSGKVTKSSAFTIMSPSEDRVGDDWLKVPAEKKVIRTQANTLKIMRRFLF